jgi:PilZ domain
MNPPPTERRKQERLALRLPVRFNSLDGSPAMNCMTENISSNGFYCICPEALVPGERRDVHLSLPARGYSRSGADVDLQCQVRVVRIDSIGTGPGFGVACQIERYTLTWEEASR